MVITVLQGIQLDNNAAIIPSFITPPPPPVLSPHLITTLAMVGPMGEGINTLFHPLFPPSCIAIQLSSSWRDRCAIPTTRLRTERSGLSKVQEGIQPLRDDESKGEEEEEEEEEEGGGEG